MQWVSSHQGQLLTSTSRQDTSQRKTICTGLEAWDAIAPQGGLAKAAIHELLYCSEDPIPMFAGLTFAEKLATDGAQMNTDKIQKSSSGKDDERRKMKDSIRKSTLSSFIFHQDLHPSSSVFICAPSVAKKFSAIVWCDPKQEIYPPAIAGMGISSLYLLHPKSAADELWAVTESLRCKGVGVTIASPKRLDRTQARRLQLAVEQGGGVGILMRTLDRNAEIYSAVTRWLVKPVPGERAVQKWKIQLLHGHGGRVGESFILERNRETHLVRATAEFSHRPVETRRRA